MLYMKFQINREKQDTTSNKMVWYIYIYVDLELFSYQINTITSLITVIRSIINSSDSNI